MAYYMLIMINICEQIYLELCWLPCYIWCSHNIISSTLNRGQFNDFWHIDRRSSM